MAACLEIHAKIKQRQRISSFTQKTQDVLGMRSNHMRGFLVLLILACTQATQFLSITSTGTEFLLSPNEVIATISWSYAANSPSHEWSLQGFDETSSTWTTLVTFHNETCSSGCPPGSYGTPSTGCTLCPEGTFASTGVETEAECTPCPAGTYAGTTGNDAIEQCTLCPAGTFSSTEGETSLAACVDCPAGTYAEMLGSDAIEDCVAGPAGTSAASVGNDALSDCVTCPAGTFSMQEGLSLVSECTACAAGTYASTTGNTNAAACLACPAGTYASTRK